VRGEGVRMTMRMSEGEGKREGNTRDERKYENKIARNISEIVIE
jgi:hypothetical protein